MAGKTKKEGSQTASKSKASKAIKKDAKKAASNEAMKKRKWRPGTVALREVKKQQKSTHTCLPRAAFARHLRHIVEHNVSGEPYRWNYDAIDAGQEATENYMVGLFEDASLICINSKRITVQSKDLKLAHRIRGDDKKDFVDRGEQKGVEDWRELKVATRGAKPQE